MDDDLRSAADDVAAARRAVAERDAVAARLRTAQIQIVDRRAASADLRGRVAAEERDVRTLQGVSFASLLARLVGNREERLTRERAEALHARIALDASDRALESLVRDADRLRRRLAACGDPDARLADALVRRERELRGRGGAETERLDAVDARAAAVRVLRREIDEALAAAEEARAELSRVAGSLDSARRWGTFDLLGGGAVATWVKHSRLDDARGCAVAAQRALDRLARELRDVGAAARGPLVAEVAGFSRFADFFLDGLVFDWLVQSKIRRSVADTERTLRDVERIRDDLRRRRDDVRREAEELAAERVRILGGA